MAAASSTIIDIAVIEIAVPLTPYSSACTNRTEPIAAANPATAPASTIKSIRAETIRAMFDAGAPKAIRIPIFVTTHEQMAKPSDATAASVITFRFQSCRQPKVASASNESIKSCPIARASSSTKGI